MKHIVTSLLLIFSVFGVVSQGFQYREVSFHLLQNQTDESLNMNISEYTDLTHYLPDGYQLDGSVDYTEYIQRGLNENRKVVMPDFPILLNDTGLDIPSNTTIAFRPKSELLLKNSKKGSYQIIRIHNKNNINIYNAKITGDRFSHIGDSGEWGMGISIRGSDNIGIFNPIIKECWGDGIYIGHLKTPSTNITIKGAFIDFNRRNGISIISVDSLVIEKSIISNSFGTDPQTGIDFEPNYSVNKLDNINIKNVTTYNNYKNGVLIHLNKLPSEHYQTVNINFTNFADFYSTRAVRVSGSFTGNKKTSIPLGGKISFENPKFTDNKYPPSLTPNPMFPEIIIIK